MSAINSQECESLVWPQEMDIAVFQVAEFYEVSFLLNESKICVLWSRRWVRGSREMQRNRGVGLSPVLKKVSTEREEPDERYTPHMWVLWGWWIHKRQSYVGEEKRSPWVVLGTPDFTKEVRLRINKQALHRHLAGEMTFRHSRWQVQRPSGRNLKDMLGITERFLNDALFFKEMKTPWNF